MTDRKGNDKKSVYSKYFTNNVHFALHLMKACNHIMMCIILFWYLPLDLQYCNDEILYQQFLIWPGNTVASSLKWEAITVNQCELYRA